MFNVQESGFAVFLVLESLFPAWIYFFIKGYKLIINKFDFSEILKLRD